MWRDVSRLIWNLHALAWLVTAKGISTYKLPLDIMKSAFNAFVRNWLQQKQQQCPLLIGFDGYLMPASIHIRHIYELRDSPVYITFRGSASHTEHQFQRAVTFAAVLIFFQRWQNQTFFKKNEAQVKISQSLDKLMKQLFDYDGPLNSRPVSHIDHTKT